MDAVTTPSKKQGDGRQQYPAKQQKVLQSYTHLIAIDLLPQREPLPLAQGTVSSIGTAAILLVLHTAQASSNRFALLAGRLIDAESLVFSRYFRLSK